MTQTFKKGAVFLITVLNLQVMRMIFSALNLSDNIANWLFSLLMQVVCMGIIPYLLYRFWVNKDIKVYAKDMRLNAKISPWSIPLAIGIGFLVFFINTSISSLWYAFLTNIGYTYVSGVSTIYSSWEVLLFEIITTAMLPAFFEELTDRGLLLAVIDNESSDTLKIFVVSIFFGLLHQNVAQFAPTIFGGLIMGYLAIKGASLFPAMIVHFMNNFLIIILGFSEQKHGIVYYAYSKFMNFYSSNFIIALLIAALAVSLLVFGLKAYTKLNKVNREKFEGVKAPLKQIDKALSRLSTEIKNTPKNPNINNQTADFYDIYRLGDTNSTIQEPKQTISDNNAVSSADMLEQPETQIKLVQQIIQSAIKRTKWWEYSMLYVAAFTALVTTLFTLIWGLLR